VAVGLGVLLSVGGSAVGLSVPRTGGAEAGRAMTGVSVEGWSLDAVLASGGRPTVCCCSMEGAATGTSCDG
jgi:hypothetical protein